MSTSAVRQIVSAGVVALLLAACVPQAPERQSLDELVAEVEAANAAADVDAHDHDDHDHGEDAASEADGSAEQLPDGGVEPSNDPTSEPTPPSAAGPKGEQSPGPAVAPNSDEPEGPAMEQHDDFPITATLSASCVQRGGAMTLTVEAGQDTAVVYLAFYAGGEDGAPAPYGDGHGGNGGDMTDSGGRFQDTWMVSAQAPVGPARVEVQAARSGEQRSTAVLRFDVVEAGTSGCGG